MSKKNVLRRWKLDRTRSWFHLVYGIPIGVAFIVIICAASHWMPIPTWLIIVIIVIEAFVFLVDGINVVTLTRRIRRTQNKV